MHPPGTESAARVPIVMYHEVATSEQRAALSGVIQSGYLNSVEQFDAHLDTLVRLGAQTVSLDDIVAWQAGKFVMPARPILITFDDGYLGNYQHAFPALKRRGFRATFFIATNKIGDPMMMTWAQLREMHEGGMSIESHTATHPLLSTLNAAETEQELAQSKAAIEKNCGSTVRYLSLPNGDSNQWYEQIAARLGYHAGCGSQFGANDRAAPRYFLRRIAMKSTTTERQIEAYLNGDALTFAKAEVKSFGKRALVGLLSKRVYDRLYNRVFGVQEQRKVSGP